MGTFRDRIKSGRFVVTGEVSPPAGTDYSAMLASLEILKPVCHAVNVTDNQGATLHLSSMAASRVLLDHGLEPVFQQTCRDRNRLALQSDALAAWTLGLENVLAVTGDDTRGGDHPESKSVYDIDSTQLIVALKRMNEGFAMNDRELAGGTDFFIGAAVFPEAEPWPVAKARAAQKVEAGAEFFQTQAVMDIDIFAERVREIQELGVKVIGGILLLKSPRVIDFINRRLAGLTVPEHVSSRIVAAEDPLEEAIALAIEQAKVIHEVCDGIHVMPLGADAAVPRILEGAGITLD